MTSTDDQPPPQHLTQIIEGSVSGIAASESPQVEASSATQEPLSTPSEETPAASPTEPANIQQPCTQPNNEECSRLRDRLIEATKLAGAGVAIDWIAEETKPIRDATVEMASQALRDAVAAVQNGGDPKPNAILIYDPFEPGKFDEAKWTLSPGAHDHFFKKNGFLHLKADGSDGPTVLHFLTGIVPTNHYIEQMSFALQLRSIRGHALGLGMWLGIGGRKPLPQRSRRDMFRRVEIDHILAVVPDPRKPVLKFLICEDPPCFWENSNKYAWENSYKHLGRENLRLNSPSNIQIIWTGNDVEFWVDGSMRASGPAGGRPIGGWKFSVAAPAGTAIHATVRDLHVDYG